MKFSKSNVSTTPMTPCFAVLWKCSIGIHLDSFKIYSPLSELAMKLGLHKDDKGAGAARAGLCWKKLFKSEVI